MHYLLVEAVRNVDYVRIPNDRTFSLIPKHEFMNIGGQGQSKMCSQLPLGRSWELGSHHSKAILEHTIAFKIHLGHAKSHH